jgi:DNA-binding transcriptional ArsR family regulator
MYGIGGVMSALHPTVWRTCRVLSNEQRLKLLWRLFQFGEGSVTVLGIAADLQEPVASTYLRALNARGLISAKRKMNYVFYRPEANPEVEHAGVMLDAMRACYNDFMPLSKVSYHMTAFTHPRRLEIVRALHHGDVDAGQISVQTGIPPQALARHVKKLVARGYVEKNERELRLVEQKAGLANDLLSIVIG